MEAKSSEKPQRRIIGKCAHCGKVFRAQRRNRRYCSNSCKQKAYTLRMVVEMAKHLPVIVIRPRPKKSWIKRLLTWSW